jgi:2-polyprenyl-3-methyl-5-hydroxy-6-metoxy-1,4-benzoquinol methylase
MDTVDSTRAAREIAHGRKLALGHPERTWGWGTRAGQLRAIRRAELIAGGAHLGPGVRALEIGCGTGNFTELFAKTGAHLVAVDISAELLDRARARGLPAQQVQFLDKRFEECDVDGPFGAVIGSSVLHHLDIETALGKIYELMTPGGVLSFAEPNMLNPQVFLQKNLPWLKELLGDSPDETAFVRWSFERLLYRIGFRGVRIVPFDWLHPHTPMPLIEPVRTTGRLLEQVPGVREFAGSLYIQAARPRF